MAKRDLSFENPHGATPLDPNELKGLRADSISTQAELNQLEQGNILKAKLWLGTKRHKNILTDSFVRELHKRMFKDVWKWAGTYRLSDKSIGIPWQQIPVNLASLLNDADFWCENNTYPWDELGARFHHRLVLIHAFPNGNGRHARLMTDIFLKARGQQPFSWGSEILNHVGFEFQSPARPEYIASLQEADNKKYDRLIRFVRS
jgi:Fic-DOC domain mobile mystery protein B